MIHLRRRLKKPLSPPRISNTQYASLSFLFSHSKKFTKKSEDDTEFFHLHTISSVQSKHNRAYYSAWSQDSPAPPVPNPISSHAKLHLLDSRAANDQAALLSRNSRWRQIIADLVVQYCPYPRSRTSICLLPDHPLVIVTLNLLHAGLSLRALILLDRISQGAATSTKPLSSLYLSPAALEVLVDTAIETEALNVLPSLTRELARTQSTSTLSQPHHSALSLQLSVVYEKLMNAHFMMDDPGSTLSIYSAAIRAAVPCGAFIFKRAIQSLFKRLVPTPDSDMRRISQPRRADVGTGFHARHSSTSPSVDAILVQLKGILDRVAVENIPLSSRILADIFRGLGSILKLETQGTEPEKHAPVSHDPSDDGTQQGATQSVLKNPSPRFRLDRLVLDQETWTSIGKIIANILTQTGDTTSSEQHGGDGRMFLLMAWADVMLSLREDIADAVARATVSKSILRALSSRVNSLIGTEQAWSYQKTFDQLAKLSYLRPHHVNSYGSIGSEIDPALDLPAGPAPGQWPVSRTLVEAQRMSLLIRDRLIEGDSLAALLQFHSLASLCGAFRRLCDTHAPEDAPSLLAHTPRGGVYQRPPEAVLAETRQELDVRVESVYIRLAGHALRTGDSGYVNDVLELAYTLPPRPNKFTFSRVWKRSMGAFVSWRSDWHGSAGIGRAFKTLAHLLGIGPGSSSQAPVTSVIDRMKPKAIVTASLDRNLFDLTWLRQQHTWPALGRNVFPRAYIVSALINRAEESTPPYLRPGAKPDRTMSPKHLQDAQRAAEEAETRRAVRWLRENHPYYMPRPGDPTPSVAELDARARAEAEPFRAYDWDGAATQVSGSGEGKRTGHAGDYSVGVPATTILVNVFEALSVPISTSEAQRLDYHGPTYTKRPDKDPALPPSVKA